MANKYIYIIFFTNIILSIYPQSNDSINIISLKKHKLFIENDLSGIANKLDIIVNTIIELNNYKLKLFKVDVIKLL